MRPVRRGGGVTLSSRSPTTAPCPFHAAPCNGVSPSLFCTLSITPDCASSACTQSTCPPREAQCSGVAPALSRPLTDTLLVRPEKQPQNSGPTKTTNQPRESSTTPGQHRAQHQDNTDAALNDRGGVSTGVGSKEWDVSPWINLEHRARCGPSPSPPFPAPCWVRYLGDAACSITQHAHHAHIPTVTSSPQGIPAPAEPRTGQTLDVHSFRNAMLPRFAASCSGNGSDSAPSPASQ